VAEGAKPIGVPDTVMAETGLRIGVPKMYWEALFAVTATPPTVIAGSGGFASYPSGVVLPPMIVWIAEGASDTGVPAIVICGPPGIRV